MLKYYLFIVFYGSKVHLFDSILSAHLYMQKFINLFIVKVYTKSRIAPSIKSLRNLSSFSSMLKTPLFL